MSAVCVSMCGCQSLRLRLRLRLSVFGIDLSASALACAASPQHQTTCQKTWCAILLRYQVVLRECNPCAVVVQMLVRLPAAAARSLLRESQDVAQQGYAYGESPVHGHRSRGDIGYDRPFSPEDEPVHRNDSIGRGFPQEEVPGSDFYDRGYDSGGPDGSSRHARGGPPQLERRDSRQQPQHHQRVAFDDFAVADGHEGYYVEDEPGYGMVWEPPGVGEDVSSLDAPAGPALGKFLQGSIRRCWTKRATRPRGVRANHGLASRRKNHRPP